MRFPLVLGVCVLLIGCDSAPGPRRDAGVSDASVQGDFEVALARRGTPITAQSPLPVDFGCQGGAHVELDVTATDGAPMRGATFTVSVIGGPQPAELFLTMRETPDGAQAEAALANFGDFGTFVAPDSFDFPEAASLRVTVIADDGSAVTVEHDVLLEMGSSCTCMYNEPQPGTVTVGSFAVDADATGCEPVQITLEGLTFTTGPNMNFFFPPETHTFEWPAQCVDALGLEAGGELSVDLVDSFPGQPCDPGGYFVGPSTDDFACDCPGDS